MTATRDHPAILQDVRKRFSRRGPWVLDGVDMDFRPGSVALITGGNGSGKSTLLRIMAQLTRPTKGAVQVSKTMSYVPEHHPEAMAMTAFGYLGHLGRMRGLDQGNINARRDDLLDRLGLKPSPHVAMKDLSKGNRQKVLLAQAFMAPVRLVVLDEPFSGLDVSGRDALNVLVADTREAGAAIVASVHDGNETLVADRFYRLENGRVVEGDVPASGRSREIPLVSVVLSDRTQVLDRDAVAAMPSVVRALPVTDLSELVLEVRADASDQFLAAAIALGWSIVTVTRGAPRISPETGP